MATLLDVSILQNFSIIFTFLLVYIIVYATLEWGKPFGSIIGGDGKSGKGIHALISLTVAFLSLFYPPVVAMITFVVPWFFLIGLILFFIIFLLKMFTGESDFSGSVFNQEDTRLRNWIIIIAIVILIFGFGRAFGSDTLQAGQWAGINSGGEESLEEPEPAVNDDPTGLRNDGVTGNRVATDDFNTNVLNTLVNPKVLGMILVLVIAMFAMFLLGD